MNIPLFLGFDENSSVNALSCMHVYTTLLEKYPTLLFCENLVDFNEARLQEANLNRHTHP